MRTDVAELLNYFISFWYLLAAAIFAALIKDLADIFIGQGNKAPVSLFYLFAGGFLAVLIAGAGYHGLIAQHAELPSNHSTVALLFSVMKAVGAPCALVGCAALFRWHGVLQVSSK